MDKVISSVTSKLYQYVLTIVRIARQTEVQIITALVLVVIMLAIAFAPASNRQPLGSSAMPQIGQPSGIVLAEVDADPRPCGGGGGGYCEPKGT